MLPETFAKYSETENANSRNELHDASDLETELNIIGNPEFDQMPIWSTLTDKLEYPDHIEKTSYLLSRSNKQNKEIKTKYNEKLNFMRSILYYFLEEKEQSCKVTETQIDPKTQNKLNSTNIPNLWKSEAYKQFSDMTGESCLSYDPWIDISTTYLYSTKEAQVWKDNDEKTFLTGVIPLMGSLRTVGKLMNGAPCRMLFDSGAALAMISTAFYKWSKILHSYPKYSIPKINIKIADDLIMTLTEAVKIVVNVRGHDFEIIAYLLDLGGSLDLMFGVKSVTEVKGKVDFSNQEFTFTQISIPIKPTKEIWVPPKRSLNYIAKLDKCPKGFEGGKIMLKMITDRSDLLPKCFRPHAKMENLGFYLPVIVTGNSSFLKMRT